VGNLGELLEILGVDGLDPAPVIGQRARIAQRDTHRACLAGRPPGSFHKKETGRTLQSHWGSDPVHIANLPVAITASAPRPEQRAQRPARRPEQHHLPPEQQPEQRRCRLLPEPRRPEPEREQRSQRPEPEPLPSCRRRRARARGPLRRGRFLRSSVNTPNSGVVRNRGRPGKRGCPVSVHGGGLYSLSGPVHPLCSGPWRRPGGHVYTRARALRARAGAGNRNAHR